MDQFSVVVDNELLALLNKDKPTINEQVGLFVTHDLTQKDMLVILYHKQPKYDKDAMPSGQSWTINQDFTLTNNNDNQTEFFLSLSVIWRELDTTIALSVPAPLSYTVQVPTNIVATAHSVVPKIPSGLAPLSQGLSQLSLIKDAVNNQYRLHGVIVRIEAKGQDNNYLNTGDPNLDALLDALDTQFSLTPFDQVIIQYYTLPSTSTNLLTAIFKQTQGEHAGKYQVTSYTNAPQAAPTISRSFVGIELPPFRANNANFQIDYVTPTDEQSIFDIYAKNLGQVFKVNGNPVSSMLIQRPYRYTLIS
ncbi:hypothetical protein [Arsenophonus sp.]|uniref:hypothetical protein n=1 Tax=Arsenophonus sp. TaxID=1872640 RepID=UPI00387A751D